ncbi:MAG: metallophosphoesterase [Phycisphaeraceae bacterium]|nr:metallophosphoesterase [Phycisphaeraceae bacterium]
MNAALPAALLLLALAASPALAQDTPDNVGHTHHLHRHNQPHETVAADGTRFTTNRDGAPLVLPTEQDAFTFVVFGDRTGGPVEGVSVLADAVRDTNLLEPDLVMTVGDLINGYNQTPEWMEQMHEFKGIMSSLLCPWFPVAGNHDIYWRGTNRPDEEHEGHYEMHFGPLWYAFEHKDCWFIALYSDEANPDTGERDFNRPENHRMSQEQFDWLASVLDRAKDARHVFVFLHHPRWIGGQYGDQWERVHQLLVSAGNVRAVFAGHIHRMRYDQRDGIEYVTLATVGGGQNGTVPQTGWLHQIHVVTVRDSQIALAAIPVGQVMDVREITAAMADECARLRNTPPAFASTLEMSDTGAVRGELRATVRNTASRPIDVTVMPDSDDSRWHITPDHNHATIRPGAEREFTFAVHRNENTADADLRFPTLLLQQEYLAEGFRYQIPETTTDIPIRVNLPEPSIAAGAPEHALRLDGDAWIEINARRASPPASAGQALTIEGWLNADSFAPRTGLLAKTENSEYGIFVSAGIANFSVHIDGAYLDIRAQDPLPTAQWHHVAGVYDGREARLYVNGHLVASGVREGRRTTNSFPLMIGADVNSQGRMTSPFTGWLDGVRLSTAARYTADFTPDRRPDPEPTDLLLLNFDPQPAIFTYDESPARNHPRLRGTARVEPVR